MQHTTKITFQLVVFLVVGILAASAAPQGNAPPSLQEQLEAQYQLTKMNGGTVVPGTVLVIQKEGALGVPSSSNTSPAATYKDGVLHPPGADVLAKSGKDIRPLPKGEKVYVQKIDVNLKEDSVMLFVAACGACNGVMPQPAYQSAVGFQFAKGYLKTASVPDVEDIIAQVFDIYTPPEAPPPPAPGQPGQGLTNDDIIKLVQGKLPDSIIIAKIQSSACAFDTGTDALIKLKQAGVSDMVLDVMVKGGKQPVVEPTAPPAPPPPEAAACNDYVSCKANAMNALISGAVILSAEESGDFKALQTELNPDKAIAMAEAYVRKYPHSDALSYALSFEANAYQSKGNAAKIVEYAEKSLDLKTDNLMSLLLAAYAIPTPQFLNLHRRDEPDQLARAEGYCQDSLKAVDGQKKQPNETEEAYAKRKAIYTSNVHADLGMIHLDRAQLGRMGIDKDELAKAEQEYKQAVSLTDAPDPSDYYRMGEACRLEGKIDNAIAAFTRASDLGQGVVKQYAERQIDMLRKAQAQSGASVAP